jgi:hypothetical protein
VAAGESRPEAQEDNAEREAGADHGVLPVNRFEFGARGGVRATEATDDERGCRAPRLRADGRSGVVRARRPERGVARQRAARLDELVG